MITSLILTLLWVATLIHAQVHRKNLFKWQDTAISSYISVDRTLQVGFILLGFSLLNLAFLFNGISLVLFSAASIGAVGVMLTMNDISSRLHIMCAVVAFLGALVGAVVVSLNSPFLLGIAVSNILYAIYGGLIQDEVGDLERYLSLGLVGWMGMACVFL